MPRLQSTLLASLALVTAVPAPAARWELGAEAVWHDNVTNAERPEDLLPALQMRLEADRSLFTRALEGGHRLRLVAGGRAESWPRFTGLNLVAPRLAAGWEWKPGLGPARPVFAAEAEGEWSVARESARGGSGGAVRLAMRQRLGAAWLVSAGHEWSRMDARGRAFDRTGREWLGRAEWNPAGAWTVTLEVRRRVGDVVSYSRPPRPDLEAIGKPITHVDTFRQDVPWIAYYFRAETRSGAAEVSHPLGRAALTLRHEYRHTLHAGPGYKNRLTALRLAVPF